jgi:hypothetical protein
MWRDIASMKNRQALRGEAGSLGGPGLDGRQRQRPAAVAERADPVLDEAEGVYKALFHFPKAPVGNPTPGIHLIPEVLQHPFDNADR